MSIIKSQKNLPGAKVLHYKNTKFSETITIDTPDQVVIPMLQHMGAPCEPLVKKGDKVYIGTKIGESSEFFSVPVHASCSGEVADIIDYHTAIGSTCKAVVIQTDLEQKLDENIKPPTITNREELIHAVRESGLVGLGGAGFPAFVKLGYKDIERVHSLVINAAECEPFITTDFRECVENAEEILNGIQLVCKMLDIKKVYIGIEDNKAEAIEIFGKASLPDLDFKVVALKSLYPQGAEKSIIYATTGIVVEAGKLPADCGVIVMNVSSVGFLGKYAKDGIPLVDKRLTVDGDCVKNPQNLRVPIGTPIEELLDYCETGDDCAKVLMGGPMMGLPVMELSAPVIKNNNAITALSEKSARELETTACIRCGKCIGICPMMLMPARLEKAYDTKNIDSLKKLRVDLCIGCGCCSFICPAHRHLAAKNQLAKLLLKKASKKEETK